MRKKVTKTFSVINLLALLVAIAAPFLIFNQAKAAPLAQAYIRLDRMKASTFTSGLVCARTPATDSGTEIDVQIVFPSGFTVSETLTNWAVATTDIPSGTTAWPGIGQATAAVSATRTVTFPSSNLSINTTYCFRWTNSAAALQTGSSGASQTGTITTRASGPTNLDTASYAVAVITDDQIVVSAVVPPNFSFSLAGGNTDTFTSSLSTTATTTSGKTFTIITNANNGWIAWARSASASGLTSASTGANIAHAPTANDNTPTTLTGANYGYVMDVSFTDSSTSGTGTVSQAAGYGAEYDGNGTTSGGTLETILRPVAAANGVTDGDTITLTEIARITPIQQAANDYTDTITVVAAGRF